MRMPSESVVAAIDVGTNAVRIKVVRRRASGSLQIIHQQRDPVRPGEGLFKTGAIPDYVADRLVAVLREYSQLCGFYQAQVRAVATSALRDATNRAEVIARVRSEARLELEVISGREEARLVCLGVLEDVAAETPSLCIDIGGGSTEVALALGELPSSLWSLDVGTVRLTDQMGGGGEYPASELARLREAAALAVRALPGPSAQALRRALGCSGTIRSLVAFATAETRDVATVDELSRAVDELASLGAEVRRRFFEARRADIIVAGAVILEAVSRQLGVESVKAVKRGLRDGILVDMMRKAAALEPRRALRLANRVA